jgi:hypothetical protein
VLPDLVTATETLGPDEGLTSITFVSPSEISLIFETKVKADAVALGFGVALAIAVALAVAMAVALADGFADALIATPLSQTSTLPFLMQVYFLLRNIITCPRRVGFTSGPLAARAP